MIRETAKVIAKRMPAINSLIGWHRNGLEARHYQRELYLDLLIRILTDVIYEDPSIHPGQSGFNREFRANGQDLPSHAHTMVGIARLKSLQQLMQLTLDEDIAGDYIETGVWRGGCCIFMKAILQANRICNRKVYVADSFAGLPPPKPDLYPADAGALFHTIGTLAVPLEQVLANFAAYGLLDENVVFVPGFFQDTLPKLEAGPFALIRLDGDMYESTIVTLNNLYPKLSPGGFAVIDDYALEGCKAAVDDFRRDHGITSKVNAVDWTGIWWQKT